MPGIFTVVNFASEYEQCQHLARSRIGGVMLWLTCELGLADGIYERNSSLSVDEVSPAIFRRFLCLVQRSLL